MKQLSKILFSLALILIVLTISTEMVEAQCRMCAAGAEANLKNGGTEGAGLNKGILYLLGMPYLLAMSIGGAWYWNYRKAKEAQESEMIQSLVNS